MPKHLEARPRERLWIGIAAALALLYALGVAERSGLDATAGIIQEADARARQHIAERIAMHHEALALYYSGIVAGCMNGGMITWKDPWTGEAKGTFCDTQILSQAKVTQ